MDKEILFLSNPAKELQKVKKDDRHSWFSLGGDFEHGSGEAGSAPEETGIEEPGKLEGWFFHPRLEPDGTDKRSPEEQKGCFHKPGGRRI